MSFLLYLVYDGIGTKEAGNLEISESHDLPKNTKLTNKTKSCSPLPNNQGQDNTDKSYFAQPNTKNWVWVQVGRLSGLCSTTAIAGHTGVPQPTAGRPVFPARGVSEPSREACLQVGNKTAWHCHLASLPQAGVRGSLCELGLLPLHSNGNMPLQKPQGSVYEAVRHPCLSQPGIKRANCHVEY